MSLQQTLERAAADIEHGDLGKARDRLEGLLRSYPESLEIRRMLGEVNWLLQYPERAGRYWYLFPDESPAMAEAKRVFAARYGNDARLMLEAIRFRGGLDSVRGTYAGDVLLDLAKRAHVSESRLERMVWRPAPGESPDVETFWERHILKVVGLVAVSLLALIVIGLGTVVDFVIGLLL